MADGVGIPNGITSGADLVNWGFLWLNHEVGHSLGLADLYSYETGFAAFTGHFSIMNDIGGEAPSIWPMSVGCWDGLTTTISSV